MLPVRRKKFVVGLVINSRQVAIWYGLSWLGLYLAKAGSLRERVLGPASC